MRSADAIRAAASVSVLVVLFVFAKVNGGFMPWFLLYVYAVFLLYETLTWFLAARHLSAGRTLSATRLSAGQTLEVTVTIERTGKWPVLWAGIREELPQRWLFQTHGAERIVQPLWSPMTTLTYTIQNLPRGVYGLGETVVETGDLFGIVKRSKVFHRRDEVIVYPRIAPVRGWTGSHPEESGLRQPTRRRSEESTNVLGVRDYVPGDRLSRIHWPASARRGALLAKEFELHVTSELLFVPDLSASSFGSINAAVFELEMTIVASLAKYAYDMRRMFGLTLYADKLKSFPTGLDQSLFMRCMEALAAAAPTGRVDFTKSLARIAQEAHRGATLVVVSPRLDKGVAVAASVARNRTPVEWFVPTLKDTLSDEEREGLQMLQAARVNVHLIRTPEQLAGLQRGGVNLALRS